MKPVFNQAKESDNEKNLIMNSYACVVYNVTRINESELMKKKKKKKTTLNYCHLYKI